MGSTISVHTATTAAIATFLLALLSDTSSGTVGITGGAEAFTSLPHRAGFPSSSSSSLSSPLHFTRRCPSSNQLDMTFRNFHSDNTMSGGGTQSDRDRREEQRRVYERHQERRRQYEQRQYEQRTQEEVEQALESERRQEQDRQGRNARSIPFIALHEHEEELMRAQQKYETERQDLQKLIAEQRRQLDALRESETKLRCKQEMYLRHYTQYNHDGSAGETYGTTTSSTPSSDDQDLRHDPQEHIRQRIARTSPRGTQQQSSSTSSVSFTPKDTVAGSPVLTPPPSTTTDINLTMLWSENQNDKMKRMTTSLILLKEENERLAEQLEIEKTRFSVEKVFMEQRLIEKDTELNEVKNELRIDREMYETTISLLEFNLEREKKKVQELQTTMQQRAIEDAAVAANQQTQEQQNVASRQHQDRQQQEQQSVQNGRGQVPGSTAAYHQQTQQKSSQHPVVEHYSESGLQNGEPVLEPEQQQQLQEPRAEGQPQEQQQEHQQPQVTTEEEIQSEWDNIPIIDPEPYVPPSTRRRQQYQARKANFKYYQPPDQEQYHQQPEPNPNDQYRNYQRSSTEDYHRYYYQQQQQQRPNQPYANHETGRSYFGYNNVNTSSGKYATAQATPYNPSSSAATAASSEDDDYYYYKSYRATPSQQRRSNSVMPHSMRPDQPYPNASGGGSQYYGNNNRNTRQSTNYRPYGSSSSTNGNGFRAMGDFGNRNP